MSIKRLLPALLLIAVPVVACESPDAEVEDDIPEPAVEGPLETEAAPVAARMITVINPMPHAMIVEATRGGDTVPLTTVMAGDTMQVRTGAPPGTEIQLIAHDSAETHFPTGTIILGSDATWTIGE